MFAFTIFINFSPRMGSTDNSNPFPNWMYYSKACKVMKGCAEQVVYKWIFWCVTQSSSSLCQINWYGINRYIEICYVRPSLPKQWLPKWHRILSGKSGSLLWKSVIDNVIHELQIFPMRSSCKISDFKY